MNLGDWLNEYGVPFVSKPLSYKTQVWLNRVNLNGKKQLLTGGVFHTEGYPEDKKLNSTADRSAFDYFNSMMSLPKEKRACTHGYFTFSGLLELYLDIEQGSWGAGNDNDNIQRIQFETQDNGYWRDGSRYTDKQYRSWAGTLCAVREWSLEHQNIDIPFRYGANGWDLHRTISTGRACPGALDTDRIFREAQVLWDARHNPQPPADPCANIKAELVATQNMLKQVENEKMTLKEELNKKDGQISDLNDEIRRLSSKVNDTSTELEMASLFIDKQASEIKELKETNKKLKQENDDLIKNENARFIAKILNKIKQIFKRS